MTGQLVIVGCGGFGREVYAIAQTLGWQVLGFVDDSPSPDAHKLVARLGAAVLGPVDSAPAMPSRPAVAMAIGDPAVRARLVAALDGHSMHFPVLVHPDTTIGADVALGPGTIVAPGVRLSVNVDDRARLRHLRLRSGQPFGLPLGECHRRHASLDRR